MSRKMKYNREEKRREIERSNSSGLKEEKMEM